MNAPVPGLPDGFVDSLREAALNGEIERATILVDKLNELMDRRSATNRSAVIAVIQNQLLTDLAGEQRRQVEEFLNDLPFKP